MSHRIAHVEACLAACFLVLSTPGLSTAQVCVGAPIPGGHVALGVGTGATQHLRDYGVGVNVNLPGPLGLLAGYRFGEHSETKDPVHNFNAAVAYDISVPAVQVCPRVMATHSRISGTASKVNTTVVGIGAGFGRTVPLGTATLGPYVVPQLLIRRTRGTATALGHTFSLDDNATAVGVVVGATLDVSRFLVTASLERDGFADSHLYYTIGVGWTL